MATITVRNLGPNGDPLYGQGQANFISDIAAVAQILKTRLLLFQGEWWADLTDGTPWFQSILGSAPNLAQINLLLTQRILGTPFVTGILSLTSSFNAQTFSFSATVQTAFGAVTVSNQPTIVPRGI